MPVVSVSPREVEVELHRSGVAPAWRYRLEAAPAAVDCAEEQLLPELWRCRASIPASTRVRIVASERDIAVATWELVVATDATAIVGRLDTSQHGEEATVLQRVWIEIVRPVLVDTVHLDLAEQTITNRSHLLLVPGALDFEFATALESHGSGAWLPVPLIGGLCGMHPDRAVELAPGETAGLDGARGRPMLLDPNPGPFRVVSHVAVVLEPGRDFGGPRVPALPRVTERHTAAVALPALGDYAGLPPGAAASPTVADAPPTGE